MSMLNERLIELMEEKGITAKGVADALGLSSLSTIYMWRNGDKGMLIDNAMKLADLFNCSVDYLVGLSDDYGDSNDYVQIPLEQCPPFGIQLEKMLKAQRFSQIQLVKFANISPRSLSNWLKGEGVPNIETVMRIAEYIGVSMDELVGRTT